MSWPVGLSGTLSVLLPSSTSSSSSSPQAQYTLNKYKTLNDFFFVVVSLVVRSVCVFSLLPVLLLNNCSVILQPIIHSSHDITSRCSVHSHMSHDISHDITSTVCMFWSVFTHQHGLSRSSQNQWSFQGHLN